MSLSHKKTIQSRICLVLVVCLLFGMLPFGTLAATQEVSITGISAYNFRGSDWYIIVDTNISDFALTSISGLKAPMDGTTAQVWFQINSQLGVSAGSFAFTLAADKAEHTVTIPAGTELGGYTVAENFVFYTHADGSVTTEATEPEVTEPEEKTVSITGIQASMYRPGNSDWYIIVNTDIADFALTAISGLKAPMDDTTAQVWFQINSQLSIPAGSFALTLAADKAEHTVTIPAGTVLGEYTLERDFVFYTHADGTLTAESSEPETTVPETTAPAENTVSITGIQSGTYRSGNSDWYIIVNTDIADFALTAISGLKAPMDDTTAQVWFQINSQLSIPAGSFALTLATDKAEHTVTIPAGTELGGYTVAEDFVFYTHADGSVTTEDTPEETEPTTEATSVFQITGIVAYNYRSANSDWYIELQTNQPSLSLDAVASLRNLGVTSDGAAAGGWFQITTDNPGQVEFDIDIDKNEHTVVLPAGMELGGYTLEKDFVFYTHADGSVTTENIPEETEPTTEATPVFQITGIVAYNYRSASEDWYIILQTNQPDFRLDAVASLRNLGVTSDSAAVGGWFQITTDNPGQLGFSLSVDKSAHTIMLPAGLELGGYTLEKDFVFYTDAAGHVTTENIPEETEPTTEATPVFQITGIVAYNYRSASEDWYIILQTNQPDFRLDAVASLRNLGVTSDSAAVGGWFQITTDNPGQLGFSLSVDKSAHTIVLPAGLELGGYTLEKDFVFYTDAAGHVTTENTPEETEPATEPPTTEPTEPQSYELSITGVASGTYRSANNDWYIILNTDNSAFELDTPTGWVAPLAEGGAQVWFQSNAAMGQSSGKLIFTLAAGKDEHSVTIPAGLTLGNYTLKDDFTFYTHRSGVVDTVRPTVLKGWSMTLGDNLDMNFFVSVAESEIANTRVQISVEDETFLLYPEAQDHETGNYIFSVELAAAQMTETVTFALLVGDSVIQTNTYTARQYADYILNNDQFNETTKNLVGAMLVYGAKAQSYFECNTDSYADADIEHEQKTVPAEIAPPVLTGAVDGLRYYGASMLFTSKHAVRYYFVLSDGADIADYTFTAGEEVLTAKAKDGMYCVDVGQINPQDLDKPIEVTVTCGEKVLTVGYSAMHYIVRKYNSGTGSELKALLQAMYTYHLAAEDYVVAAYKPTSLTIALYDPQESVYGFTFNTNEKPLNTVVQIKKVGTEEWVEHPVSSVSATTYNENDTIVNYYISKTEVQLEKGSSYIYRIYDKEAEVGTEYVTLTAKDPQTDAFTFVHVSDSQEGPTYFNRVLAQVSDNADFILHTGDVVQNSKYEQEWTEMLDDNFAYLSRIPVMALSGNHETTYNTRGIAEIFKHFNNCIPAQASTNLGYFYSFIYGDVKFIMLNTNDLTQNKLKAEQYDWLVNELETNTCKWTVVALHNPLYSAGRYGSDSSRNEIALALQQQLRGIFAQYGVDIVLQGHDHIISRTFPIDGNGIAQSESIENIDGVEYSVDPSGVIYLMNGPAGSQTRVPYLADDPRYAYAESSQAASWAELSFEGDILTVTVKYHDGTNENVYHTWGIKKDASNIPALRISSVYPYADFAKAYLDTEDPNVSDYTCGSVNPNVDTVISWESNSQATGYTVLLSTERDYSNAKTYQVPAEDCSVAVNNLLKAQTYYVKVTADGTSMATEASFTTTDLGPRVMTVDGVYNVRDMGGYLTASGKTTKQGLIYRGGALSPSADYPNVQITESGIATMAEEMGIRTEIDFRNSTEALGVTESCIPNAELIYCTLGGYDSGMIDYAESYKKVFQLLARPENYPIYYHCTGGADRTGTVSYLLGALLGMDKTDLIRDYEFTSFSMYGERNSKTTKYAFGAMCALLETYEGATLADKAEQYLLSIGVTEDEIFNIRAIMFGEEPKELPEDGADTPETTVPDFFDYMNSKETITLNSSMTSVTSDLAVGYGKTVRIPLDTQIVSTGSGRLLVYIGSYGLNMRGNSLRFHVNDGADTEIKPRPDSTAYQLYNNFFDDGGYMDLTVTLTDTGVTFDVVAVNSRGSSKTFSYTYENVRVTDEIASSDAKITVKIDPTQVSEVILAP